MFTGSQYRQGQIQLGQQAHQIDLKNFRLAKNMTNYQKQLQKQIFKREDNSIRRRIADLKSAGLSPILAAGQGARAGATIPMTPPKQETRGLSMQQQAMQNQMINLNNMLSRITDIAQTTAQTGLTIAQKKGVEATTDRTIQTTDHEAALHTENLRKAILENDFLAKTFADRVDTIHAESWIKAYQRKSALYQAQEDTIDAQWKLELRNYILSIADKNGFYPNPQILTYLTVELDKLIKQYNYDYYKKRNLATSGSINLQEMGVAGIGMLWDNITNLIKRLGGKK